MKEADINLQVHYIPVHLHYYYKTNYSYKSDDFEYSVHFYKNEVSFPIYPSLSEDDQQYIIEKTFKYLGIDH